MIVNCKERFGYAYIWTCDRTMSNILSAYCEGRSYLWNCFFGWRKTNKNNQEFYWIPVKKLELLIKLAKEINADALN